MKSLLVDSDVRVINWARSTYSLYPVPFNKAIGILNENRDIIGAIIFEHFNGTNCDLSYYGKNTVSLGIVRYIAHVAATEFNVARVTVVTSKRNKKLIKALIRIGFKKEGIQPRFYGHTNTTYNTAVRLAIFRERIDQIAVRKLC